MQAFSVALLVTVAAGGLVSCSTKPRTERTGALVVVRSSALVEDRFGSSFAGQFESFIGVESEEDFVTAVRSCWARSVVGTRLSRPTADDGAGAPAAAAMGDVGLVIAEAKEGFLSASL